MAELTEDQLKIQALEAQVASLTSEKADLAKQINTLTASNADKDTQLELAQKYVTELKKKIADQEAVLETLPTVKVGKDLYELVTEFFWKDQEITAVLLNENSKLAEELVKEGVANLRKVVKK